MSRRRARLFLICAFATLVGVGAAAIAFNAHSGAGSGGLLPPLPQTATETSSNEAAPAAPKYVESDFGAQVPGAASLAGEPEEVVRRFAEDWANRDVVLTEATKREMVGLSAGVWASAVFRQAQLTLPIEGSGSEGGMEMMKLSTLGPRSKTALVVTRERLRGPEGSYGPYRYAIYLARLDRVTPRGYAITAWEPQQ